jgi:hypothetical protein
MSHTPEWDLLLYVKSVEHIVKVMGPADRDQVFQILNTTGFFPGHASGIPYGRMDAGNFDGKAIKEREMPEDEAEAVHKIWSLALSRGRRLHIVDVAKDSVLRRVIEEHLHHLKDFPVLLRKDGQRLEGISAFTSENLDKFLADGRAA